MNQKLIRIVTISTIFFAACNNSGSKKQNEGPEKDKDTVQSVTITDDKDMKAVMVTYSDVDPKAAASLTEIVSHYLHIKNALANDNSDEAARGATAIKKVVDKLDKSFFTAEQKAVYDRDEEELKEHAEHIGKNNDNIKHQRLHFSFLSEVMYNLVKAFGGGQALYHDHCPMYNEDKGGAMWLSETREIKNPYFGSEMPKCGSVEEVIK
jgi:uncharacterized protein DUF3347